MSFEVKACLSTLLSQLKVYAPDMLSLSLVDYPKEPACVIFLSGCNLRCPYCQNWKLREAKEEDLVSLEAIMLALQRNFLVSACKITGGEPLLQADVLIELSKLVKARGLKFGVDTNGTLPESLVRLLPHVDLISIDVKSALKPESYSKIAGIDLSKAKVVVKNITKSLNLLFSYKGVYVDVRTVIIPDVNDSIDELSSIAEDLRKLGYVEKASRGEASYTLVEFVPENAYSEEFRSKRNPRADELLELASKLDLPNIHVTHRALGFFIKAK
ncbi:MAG: anaerobic ribonucleoside-triphosphate reductase activating protein [Candidatus Methanomethylicota archaeon]|uniref:Anaerobic ribonucleoside-triphosphate reductase activating protein n=1 Tax=Thermoproteota archaeon TaxID=2056631 RepID=A0A497ERN2_9CREN|nr:MAG: anaerobic ribonucleoside-triphosphate reductase activating protein [Candidatus Verstraetearchaeota archaeon]